MSTALGLMIATYILVRIRLLGRTPKEWDTTDRVFGVIGDLVCLVCWFVVVVQALRAAFG